MKTPQKTAIVLLGLIILVYAAGMFNDIMEVDAAQYAVISQEMLLRGDFLQVFHLGINYLDKPPLLFWLNALSFELFGFSNFSYRLPSVLATLLGLWSAYRLAKSLYDEETALLAAVILGSTQAFFLFNTDIRTDTLLTGFVIFALWQAHEYTGRGKMIHLAGASVGIGLAMLAKGPIGAMVPALALLPDVILRRRWACLLRWRTLIAIPLILLLLAPMLAGLYRQFGSHGLYFFFWLQSFGRLTGQNEWDNQTGLFFLSHNFLWSFLPWTVPALAALFMRICAISGALLRRTPLPESMTLFGFLLPFIALSTSHYQLPHYIFVLFPLAAILTAWFLRQLLAGMIPGKKVFSWLQLIPFLMMALVAFLIGAWLFPGMSAWIWTGFGLLMAAGAVTFILKPGTWSRLVVPATLGAIAFNLVMNLYFYPSVLRYQAGAVAARWARDHEITPEQMVIFYHRSHAFTLYMEAPVIPYCSKEQEVRTFLERADSVWFMTDDTGLDTLKKDFIITREEAFLQHHPTTLNWKFLNPETRHESLTRRYLVRLKEKP